jgi:hypothetical protein
VFDAPEERCARELEFAEAIDCAHFVMRRTGPSKVGVGQARKPATGMHVVFLRSEHRALMIFGLRDCGHLAQPNDSAWRAEEQKKNVEADVEYVPRPRPWPSNPDRKTGRNAVVLNRTNRHCRIGYRSARKP